MSTRCIKVTISCELKHLIRRFYCHCFVLHYLHSFILYTAFIVLKLNAQGNALETERHKSNPFLGEPSQSWVVLKLMLRTRKKIRFSMKVSVVLVTNTSKALINIGT